MKRISANGSMPALFPESPDGHPAWANLPDPFPAWRRGDEA